MRRAGYRVLRQAGRTEPEGLPGPYPSRHAVPPWSRLHGQPERTRGTVPTGISAVPNGNIRGCERTVCKRNIAGVKEDKLLKQVKEGIEEDKEIYGGN